MNNIANFVFLPANQLIDIISKNFLLSTTNLPSKVLLYTVTTPHNSYNTLMYFKNNWQKFNNIMKIFANQNSGFTTKYMVYDEKEIYNSFRNQYVSNKQFLKNFTHSYEEITYEVDHKRILEKDEPFIELIYVPFNALPELDSIIQNDINYLKSEDKSYVIFMLFRENIVEKKEKKSLYFNFIENERSLQVTVTAAANSETTNSKEIGITGTNLAGYLVGLFALLVLLIGVNALYSVKTPEKFARNNLNVGKES